MINKRLLKIGIICAAVVFLAVFLYWQNNYIVLSHYKHSRGVDKAFDGFTIAQVSDLHGKFFGQNQNRLINKINSASPDIIVITGDLIGGFNKSFSKDFLYLEKLRDIAPVYFVSGNHDTRPGVYAPLIEFLSENGVTVLDNRLLEIKRDGAIINLVGLADFSLVSENKKAFEDKLSALVKFDIFTLLLSHRPELFKIYAKEGVELVLTGHAHGGQFRLPGVGGLLAPDQGLFPDFTEGKYKKDNTTMIVSRGLGNSVIPVRLFNRPELVIVKLKSE
ncbi:MAG: metallophosphoesterase [Elusimicrobiota bacterium]